MNMQRAFIFAAKQRGLTLIELLVAMAISLIVILAIVTAYTTSKRSYLVQQEFARMHQNALFAFQFMTEDIRQAGYAGCNPVINNLLNTTAANSGMFDFISGIYGWEYTGTGPGSDFDIVSLDPATGNVGDWSDHDAQALSAILAGLVMPGSDVLVIKSATEVAGLITTDVIMPTTTTINFPVATGIQQGQVVLLSDCLGADIFMNSDELTDTTLSRSDACGGHLPCNKDPGSVNFSHEYNRTDISATPTTRVITTTSRAYFIGEGASGEPALFRVNLDRGIAAAAAEELVEGAENMQILYGEDLNINDNIFMPTQYVTFDNVTDPNNIVSVRISLLMRTPGEMNRPDDARTYPVGGVTDGTAVEIDPIDDRRIRKVFNTTITLRNKLVDGRGAEL